MKRSVLSATARVVLFNAVVAQFPFLLLAAPPNDPSPLTISIPALESNFPRLDLNYYSYIRANKSFFGKDEKEAAFSTVGMEWAYSGKRMQADLGAFYSQAERASVYNVRDLYWNRAGRNVVVSVGRKRHEWSHADRFWKSGFWEPRFTWDEMRPDVNGLSGIFLSSRNWTNGWRGSVLLSPVFVPEMGQVYRNDNGRITSANPWFRTPPPHLNLGGQETPLSAEIIEPSVTKTIYTSGLAVQLERRFSESWQAYASYGFKPINQVLVSVEPYVIVGEEHRRVVAKIYPEFPYHHIATLNTRYARGPWTVSNSVTYDQPEISERISTNVSQMFGASTSLSSIVEHRRARGPHRREFYAGYIRTFGGVESDVGEFADIDTIFEYRPRWFSAFKFGAREIRPLRRGRGEWGQGIEVTYDVLVRGALLLSELTYSPNKNVQFEFKMDLLGPFNDDENAYEKSFVRSYRANDRVQLGMQYVF